MPKTVGTNSCIKHHVDQMRNSRECNASTAILKTIIKIRIKAQINGKGNLK